MLLDGKVIPNLKFVTISILKSDSILIPVCMLEKLLERN